MTELSQPVDPKYLEPKEYSDDIFHAIAELERNVDAPWSPAVTKTGPFALQKLEASPAKIKAKLIDQTGTNHGEKGRIGGATFHDGRPGRQPRSVWIVYSSDNSPRLQLDD